MGETAPLAPPCPQCSRPFSLDIHFCFCGYFRDGEWICKGCMTHYPSSQKGCPTPHCVFERNMSWDVVIKGRLAHYSSVARTWSWVDGGGLLKEMPECPLPPRAAASAAIGPSGELAAAASAPAVVATVSSAPGPHFSVAVEAATSSGPASSGAQAAHAEGGRGRKKKRNPKWVLHAAA
jgi:hypothetical protein